MYNANVVPRRQWSVSHGLRGCECKLGRRQKDMFVQFVLMFTFDFAGNIEMTEECTKLILSSVCPPECLLLLRL